jgi:hypothetical protein
MDQRHLAVSQRDLLELYLLLSVIRSDGLFHVHADELNSDPLFVALGFDNVSDQFIEYFPKQLDFKRRHVEPQFN